MLVAIGIIFVIGYLAIALEHFIKVDKAATAVLTGVLCWTLYVAGRNELIPDASIPSWYTQKLAEESRSAAPQTVDDRETASATKVNGGTQPDDSVSEVKTASVETGPGQDASEARLSWLAEGQLTHYVSEIAGILFFLMGAMTIVELVDAFEGFSLITSRITTNRRTTLYLLVGFITFFLSSVLDNLTTTIVMVSLLKKLVADNNQRIKMAGLVVIAANAGGAWTVIGDVTTTMLWIKHKIDTVGVMFDLFLPSMACLLVPLFGLVWTGRSVTELDRPDRLESVFNKNLRPFHQRLMLAMGIGGLVAVPIFKSVFHLPPFMGMMLSLSIIWIVAEIVRHDLDTQTRSSTHVVEILRKIDLASVLFFLGILLAVGSLGATGVLGRVAVYLNETVGNRIVIAVLIGLISSVVDNVPLVAAGIEMYTDPQGHWFWSFLAYCAGTGGSCLIIGSAAGVAAMGLEKIDFFTYFRRIAVWALLGYLAGVVVYLGQQAALGRWSQLV